EPAPEAVAVPLPLPSEPAPGPATDEPVREETDEPGWEATEDRGPRSLRRVRSITRAATAVRTSEDALAMLRDLPDGWQRRRAAERLLAAGALDHLDPLAVVRSFARRGDRTHLAAR